MKNTHHLFPVSLPIVLALFFTGCATHTDQTNQSITVVRVKGTARYSADSRTWCKLQQKVNLQPGALIQTAPNSLVDIAFDYEFEIQPPIEFRARAFFSLSNRVKVLRVFENSAIRVEKAVKQDRRTDGYADNIWVTLHAGQIMGRTLHNPPNSKYEVSFPAGFATVAPDSAFAISSTGVTYVLEGAVNVFLMDKNTFYEVPRDHALDPSTGTVIINYPEFPIYLPRPNAKPSGLREPLRKF